MRKIILATIASMALAGTAFAQGGQAGATGAGNAPGNGATGSTSPSGTSQSTGGSFGTGHGPENPNGAGANIPNAVQNQSPSNSGNTPTAR